MKNTSRTSRLNPGLIIGLVVGAAAGATLGILLSGDKGKKVLNNIKDAAGKAEKELKSAVNRFEEKLTKSKEFAQDLEKRFAENLEKKASRFMKQKTS
jgi:gas vesicle protein